MKSLFYLIAVIVTYFIAMLSFPVIIIGYILLLGYALIKG